ncbi:MAG: malto-oligosyltrehalose trehalohydrolase, partial [Casimicrobiaceae bacterium]
MRFGAQPGADGVRFRMWAPGAQRVGLLLGDDAQEAPMPMDALADGWFELTTARAHAGTHYRFTIDDEQVVADPASRHNPGDVHGVSEVVDASAYDWADSGWSGRPWHHVAIYELHVGTFSPGGDFNGVTARLEHLLALGVTAIELMPLADFPGERNWGYDGVLAFAPDARYGTPAELKALIDAAHSHGLMVFIDVVYNHFGPEGNYLPRTAPAFFTDHHRTPWGDAINFDGADSATVREFFIDNALYWLQEYHVDGLRLDAVHAILDDSDPDFLTQLASALRDGPGRDREIHLILENDRNEVRRLLRDAAANPVQYTAQWNDDFHHVLHRLLTGETHSYYKDYAENPLSMLARCLAEGFIYQGETSAHRGGTARGERSNLLPPTAFVNFLQNHDQIGNRALGERLYALAPAGALRGAIAILLLAPSPPLLFMGDEFGADTPFLFFCDFTGELADAVRDGRRAEFADSLAALAEGDDVADPGAATTFARSALDWDSITRDPHPAWLDFHRSLLALRAIAIVPLIPHIVAGAARHRNVDDSTIEVRWPLDD